MTQITIDLPAELLISIDERCGKNGPSVSRSEFIHRALLQYLRTESERSLEEQYIRGYMEHPETAEDTEWLDEAAAEVFANNPWIPGEKD